MAWFLIYYSQDNPKNGQVVENNCDALVARVEIAILCHLRLPEAWSR